MSRLVGLYSPAMGAGKTTLAEALRGHGYKRLPFAGPLKAMLRTLVMEAGGSAEDARRVTDGDLKQAPCPWLSGCTPRHAMQTLGTQWGRQRMHPEFWVNLWRQRAEMELAAGHSIVADDMRFPNEAAAIAALGGLTVRIERPGTMVSVRHASEGGLEDWPFDVRLLNDRAHPIEWAMYGAAELGRAVA